MSLSRQLEDVSEDGKKIINFLLKQGCHTKYDITKLLDIKLTTLNRIMNPLEEEHFIIQHSIGESSGGRKPIFYSVNPNKYYIIGIDISRIYTQVIIVSFAMEVIYKHRFNMNLDHTPEVTVNKLKEIINKALSDLKLEKEKILGVGLGTVGPLDIDKGIIKNPNNFISKGWSNVPIKAMLEEDLELRVMVQNGANVAVLMESLYGAGKGVKNVAYINCGMGIRTGVVISGNLVRSLNDAEDVLGHLVVDYNGLQCHCGNKGCLEGYASIHAITNKYNLEIQKQRRLISDIKNNDFNKICAAAEDNDETAKKIIVQGAEILGTGISNFINLLNPSLIILSGPLIMNSNLFYEACILETLKKCHVKEGKIKFSKGGFYQEDTISFGAAALVVESYLK